MAKFSYHHLNLTLTSSPFVPTWVSSNRVSFIFSFYFSFSAFSKSWPYSRAKKFRWKFHIKSATTTHTGDQRKKRKVSLHIERRRRENENSRLSVCGEKLETVAALGRHVKSVSIPVSDIFALIWIDHWTFTVMLSAEPVRSIPCIRNKATRAETIKLFTLRRPRESIPRWTENVCAHALDDSGVAFRARGSTPWGSNMNFSIITTVMKHRKSPLVSVSDFSLAAWWLASLALLLPRSETRLA